MFAGGTKRMIESVEILSILIMILIILVAWTWMLKGMEKDLEAQKE